VRSGSNAASDRVVFGVAQALSKAMFLAIVILTLTKSKGHAGEVRKTERRTKFWVRKTNPELDRAGVWLLENLAAVRSQAASRAHSR
jgi:hypothetical protein